MSLPAVGEREKADRRRLCLALVLGCRSGSRNGWQLNGERPALEATIRSTRWRFRDVIGTSMKHAALLS